MFESSKISACIDSYPSANAEVTVIQVHNFSNDNLLIIRVQDYK